MLTWILSSSVLILAVLGLGLLFRNRISHRLRYALWALVLLRLLIPGSLVESAVSVANLFSDLTAPPVFTAPVLEQTDALAQVMESHSIDPQNFEILPPAAQTRYEAEAQALVDTSRQEALVQIHAKELRYENTQRLLKLLWIIGSLLTGAVLLGANVRFGQKLRRTGQLVRSGVLPVYRAAGLETPCLFGLLRPGIYLPEDLPETELDCVLAHEQTHHRHLDHIWAVLRCLCLAIHWFNPLVWLAAKVSRAHSELACDEATLARLGEENRSRYGQVLIEMSRGKDTAAQLLLTATTMTAEKRTLYARIRAIAHKPRVVAAAVALLALVAAVAVGCTFTGAPESPTQPTEPTLPQETTAPTEPVLELPVLTELPWSSTNGSPTGPNYDTYFSAEQTYYPYASAIHPTVLSGKGAYTPVVIGDRLCIQLVTEQGMEATAQVLGAIGTATYPDLVYLGTDDRWFYCVSGSELFRLDVLGNKQTIFTDPDNKPVMRPGQDNSQYLYLTQDERLLVFVAEFGEGYGIYRAYLPDMHVECLGMVTGGLPTVEPPRSNYTICWKFSGEIHTVENIPEIDPTAVPPETQPTEPTEPPVEASLLMLMDMLYVRDESAAPVSQLPQGYYYVGVCYSTYTEIPIYEYRACNIPHFSELFASMEDPDAVYYAADGVYYKMIRAALVENTWGGDPVPDTVPEDMTLAFFRCLYGSSDSPYNQAMNLTFYKPEDIDIFEVFYKGFEEWDQRNVPLTQEEETFLLANGWDHGLRKPIDNAERFPISAIDQRLRKFFGISYAQSNKVGTDQYDNYREQNMCFYSWRSDTRANRGQIDGIHLVEPGTYQITFTLDNWNKDVYRMTLDLEGHYFHIRANVPVTE